MSCPGLQEAREPRRRSVAAITAAAASSTCSGCATAIRWRAPSSTPRPRPAMHATTTSTGRAGRLRPVRSQPAPRCPPVEFARLSASGAHAAQSHRVCRHAGREGPPALTARRRHDRATRWAAALARRAREVVLSAVPSTRRNCCCFRESARPASAAPWHRRCSRARRRGPEPSGPPDGVDRSRQPGRRVVRAVAGAPRRAWRSRRCAICSAGAACSPRTLPKRVASCAARQVSTGPTCSSPSWSA